MTKQPNEKMLKQVYLLMMKTLNHISNVQEEIDYYRKVDYRNWSDNDFFETMSEVIFYSNLRRPTVNQKLPAIKEAFSDFDIGKVASYTKKDIKRLKQTPKIIHNMDRIKATVKNAKTFQKIIKQYGSFLNYLDTFIDKEDFDGLIEDLVKRFGYIGWINVYDFLKEMGLPFIKPDRNIRRVFFRLGLTKSDKPTDEIIEGCQKIAKVIGEAVNERLCVVNCVLWTFGHSICTKRKPRCARCNLTFCRFYSTTVSCLSKR